MSQHDYTIDNQDGASFRGDINDALAAIVTQNSGSTAPTVTFPGMIWFDTSGAGVIKMRNAANTAWVLLADVLLAGKTLGGALGVDGNLTVTGALIVAGLATYTNMPTLGTSQATTSGTTKDFTSIPSWVKRITVLFNGVSTNGTSVKQIQFGTSGGIETSGYVSGAAGSTSAGAYGTSTTGIALSYSTNSLAAGALHGAVTLTSFGGNLWVASGVVHETGSTVGSFVAGTKTLSGTLERIRITTANGTDAFDAGSVNILYE